MSSLGTFLAAFALAGLDLLVLALAVKKLGQRSSKAVLLLLGLLVALKLGLLVLGVAWMSRQPWFERKALLVGLLVPFALFALWQAIQLQRQRDKRASL